MAKAKFTLSDELNKSMVTCKVRASYVHLFEPWTGDDTKTPRYSVQMIIPKDEPWLKEAKARVKKIAVQAFGKNAVMGLRKGTLKNPFRDGDLEREGDELYAGQVFVNANGVFEGKKLPGVFNQKRKDIRLMASPEEHCYSGCYARAEIKFYPFDEAGGKGIACFLFRVQVMGHGEPLSAGRPVEEVFDEVAVDDDDDLDDLDDLEDEDEPF